ncbi:MAG: rhodanese-like domain-containing protein [Pyrinomonadaceae bacterium]|nr:rhodanese-like domain-containing protein [Pyrinomonadaceae bacterium]
MFKPKFLMFAAFCILSLFAFSCESSISSQTGDSEIKQVTVQETGEAVKKENVQFIDVRTPEEYAGGHAPKAANHPLDKIETELAKLDKNKPVYVICQTGRRSQKAAETLQKAGFREIYNVKGGTSEWISAGLPTEK